MLTQSEWETQYLERIQKNKRLNGTEKTILELKNTENNTEFQKKMLTRLLNNEYRKYSIQESLKESLQKIDSQSKDFVKNIKAKQPNLRKQRAHQLIRIGALTELTGFSKDRGLIAGTFLYVKALIEQNPALENELKAQGDNLITKKEYQNTIKKLKNKTENNTKTID